MLGWRQPEYGANGFGVTEAGGNIDGGTVCQCGYGSHARNAHETAADGIIPDDRQQFPVQLA
jgi:hypothetical protein